MNSMPLVHISLVSLPKQVDIQLFSDEIEQIGSNSEHWKKILLSIYTKTISSPASYESQLLSVESTTCDSLSILRNDDTKVIALLSNGSPVKGVKPVGENLIYFSSRYYIGEFEEIIRFFQALKTLQ